MFPDVGIDALLDYTAWQREHWAAWFLANPRSLHTDTGACGDGRFPTVGDVVKHVFTVERRYVQRVAGQPLGDFAAVPSDDVTALFAAGEASREELRTLLATYGGPWTAIRRFAIPGYADIEASPQKVVLHVLVHEIRHWAQIATECRLAGHATAPQDLLASPLWGGAFRPSGPHG